MKKPAGVGSLSLGRLSELGSETSRVQRLWILTGAMLLATAVIGMVAIQAPWQEKRRQMASQLDEEKRRSELLLALQRQRESDQKTEKELLLEGGAPVLTGVVSRLAAESGLAIESVIPYPDLAVPPYTQYQIEILATTHLDNLLRFLRAVESHRPFLLVNEMEIGDPFATASPGAAPTATETLEEQRVRIRIAAMGRGKKAP